MFRPEFWPSRLSGLNVKIYLVNPSSHILLFASPANGHSGSSSCVFSSSLYTEQAQHVRFIIIIIIIIINPFTASVVGAPQMILQPVSSIFPCSPLPSGTRRTPGLSIPWCCLSTSSSVCLVFFLLSLCLAKWFWPDLMNGKHDHATAVYVSLQWSGGLRVVRLLDLGTDFLVGNMVFVWDTYYHAVSNSTA